MPREPRLRDYLTRDEVAALLRSAKKSPRYGARNNAMILLAYRHGLRASEVTGLRWSDLDLARGTIYCRRAKNSHSSLHPMKPDEGAALEKLARREQPASDYVFQSERSEKMSRSAFWRIVSNAGARAGLPVKAYAHLLRHSCGYFLANKGCDLRLMVEIIKGLVRRLVEMHQGRMQAHSALGQGSEFVVTLPMAPPSGVHRPRHAPRGRKNRPSISPTHRDS